ncbi:hypothetical protein [Alteromonas ponticola]|uniref:GIY-YIG nuclease family protein n=1 Tax=Alteromonas ponticola TaxID=2720613 RepID=A0ABX1R1I2_9ALTE|nr:hypothetical protein [Alteromonas ponticola]NMH60319.1 hypothetical protein [Alteromonas ponticola]
MDIPSYKMKFSGQVLERGFWLYVWKICYESNSYFYVGRTGDSSSPNAASPFNRIGQHLDFRMNAKGSSMAKRLKQAGIDPVRSEFEMIALGPFFEEQSDFEAHKPKRDFMATLEVEAANFLSKRCGQTVLGVHYKSAEVPDDMVLHIQQKIELFLNEGS